MGFNSAFKGLTMKWDKWDMESVDCSQLWTGTRVALL